MLLELLQLLLSLDSDTETLDSELLEPDDREDELLSEDSLLLSDDRLLEDCELLLLDSDEDGDELLLLSELSDEELLALEPELSLLEDDRLLRLDVLLDDNDDNELDELSELLRLDRLLDSLDPDSDCELPEDDELKLLSLELLDDKLLCELDDESDELDDRLLSDDSLLDELPLLGELVELRDDELDPLDVELDEDELTSSRVLPKYHHQTAISCHSLIQSGRGSRTHLRSRGLR
jgi:hypothetical protein